MDTHERSNQVTVELLDCP